MKAKELKVCILVILLTAMNFQVRAQEPSADPFLGMWALTLQTEGETAGWLEIRQEEGYLDGDLLWRSGSVLPVNFALVVENQLILARDLREIVRERDEAGEALKKTYQLNLYQVAKTGEDGLSGIAILPRRNGVGATLIQFSGKRIPAIGEAPDLGGIKYGEPVKLFNGSDLDGWELAEEGRTSGWKAVNGVLVNDPVQTQGEQRVSYGNLRTTDTFEDFNLKLEVNVPEGSNSGVYLRGRYEVQVVDSYGRDLDPHNMGALYSRITPKVAAEKPAGEWQEMDIILYKRHITVKLNGKTVIDNQPVKGVTGGAMSSDDFTPGPIFLQGDHGNVSYRNMVLTPILE